jgi:hypothetical protein
MPRTISTNRVNLSAAPFETMILFGPKRSMLIWQRLREWRARFRLLAASRTMTCAEVEHCREIPFFRSEHSTNRNEPLRGQRGAEQPGRV